MNECELTPKKRSQLRLKCGKAYFTVCRYLLWNCKKYNFSKTISDERLEHQLVEHKSVLLRQLKDVDMEYQYNKITNLKIAAKKLNGLIIAPGETFSYWKMIGKPTKSKGYVDGMILNSGSFRAGIGGGLCQLSNLIYFMTIQTNLTVVERYRHSFDVFPDSNRNVPFGSGATCVYPYRDLMIRNDTPFTFQLDLKVGDEFLEGSWRCSAPQMFKYKVIEKNHSMKAEYWGGYSRHNEIYREKYDLCGNYLGEEYVTENHAMMMYSPFLEYSINNKNGGYYEKEIN